MNSLLIRIKRRFFGKNPFQPNFDLDAFLARPANARLIEEDNGSPLYDIEQKCLVLFKYFKDKQNSRFFVAPDRLPNLIHVVNKQHGNWRENTKNCANKFLKSSLQVYNYQAPPLNKEFPWNNLRATPNNDILYQLKPHRFWFAPQIALSCLYDKSITSEIHDIFSSWLKSFSSKSRSRSHTSNLVVIQRIISLSWTWVFLSAVQHKNSKDYQLLATILMIIHEDVRFLSGRLGSSYPNNHLLIDYFGGWLIAMIWPEFINRDEWLPKYSTLLTEELSRQVYSDGSSFEHSTHYHEFACEIICALLILSKRNNISLTHDTEELAKNMLLHQICISNESSIPLQIGNATEDPLFPLDSGFGWANGALREIFRSVFDSTLASSSTGDLSVERAYWLMAGDLAAPSAVNSNYYPLNRAYDIGGFYSLYDDYQHANFIFRTGPDPKAALTAGHMHSDLLSIYLTVNEKPVILDAGTHTYRYGYQDDKPNWKEYFSGYQSHNTLSIRETDPLGKMSGDFRSTDTLASVAVEPRHISSRIAWIEAGILNDELYSKHHRGIVHIDQYYWITYDRLDSANTASESKCRYLVDSDADVTTNGNHITIKKDNSTVLTIAAGNGFKSPEVLRASVNPLGGWISPKYGELTPAPQILLALDGTTPLVATLFTTSGVINQPISINSSMIDGGMCFHIRFGKFDDVILLNSTSNTIYESNWDIEFSGSLLWIRTLNGRLNSLRWFDASLATSNLLNFSASSTGKVKFLEVLETADTLSINQTDPPDVNVDLRQGKRARNTKMKWSGSSP